MIDRGEIPVIRLGARDRTAPAALDEWLERASVYRPNNGPYGTAKVGKTGEDGARKPASRRRRVVRLISI